MSLGARSLNAVFWGAGGTVLRMALQIGAQIILARLLGPQQYGVFAIGATVISFSVFFSDIGLAYGLIQKAEVSPRDVRFVFTWQVILGALVTLVIYNGAGPISSFFGEPRAEKVVRVLSGLCFLNALAAPSLNLLKRQINFKRIQISQLVSYVLGYIMFGIPMALAGHQVWALVAAWIVQAAANLILLYMATTHPIKPLIWYEHARSQSGYGGAVLITNLVNWVVSNIDRVVVGRVFGSRDIGLYATSYNLFYSPTAAVLGVIQPVFFSASSRMVDEPAKITRGYCALLGFVSWFVLPAALGVAIFIDPIIAILYGDSWRAAASLCRPIVLAMPLFMVWGFSTPLLWTSGAIAREFQILLPLAVAWCAVCLLAATYSVQAVAWSMFGFSFLRCVVVVITVFKVTELSRSQLWAAVAGGLLNASIVASVCLIADYCLPMVGDASKLTIGILSALATWSIFPRIARIEMPIMLAESMRRALRKLPRGLKRLLFLVIPLGALHD